MTNSEADTAGGTWGCAVLAAGRGSRMRSSSPKVLHRIGGKSIIDRVLGALTEAGFENRVIVRDSSPALLEAFGIMQRFVVQEQPDGTGGALRAVLLDARTIDADNLLVLNGDLPLISPETLSRIRDAHESRSDTVVTLLTFDAQENTDVGRIVRSHDGTVMEIVEAADRRHSNAPSDALKEGNVGVYAFRSAWARDALPRLPMHDNGEYYITDLVALAAADGHKVQTVIAHSPDEALGVNTLVDLARAEQVARSRTLEALMLSGVTIHDPASTYIDATVTVAPDTVIRPNTHISGETAIGAGCEIGPDTHITDSVIGGQCLVRGSWLDEATLGDGVSVGPYARLRPGTHIASEAHIGSFGEVKASHIGRRTAMGHFGYVGDSNIGDDVNIGAGAVTCNYDGENKHRTVIGSGAFIGSGSMLVAPVEIGEGAYTAAGTVVTKNVAAMTTVAGVPAREMSR